MTSSKCKRTKKTKDRSVINNININFKRVNSAPPVKFRHDQQHKNSTSAVFNIFVLFF